MALEKCDAIAWLHHLLHGLAANESASNSNDESRHRHRDYRPVSRESVGPPQAVTIHPQVTVSTASGTVKHKKQTNPARAEIVPAGQLDLAEPDEGVRGSLCADDPAGADGDRRGRRSAPRRRVVIMTGDMGASLPGVGRQELAGHAPRAVANGARRALDRDRRP